MHPLLDAAGSQEESGDTDVTGREVAHIAGTTARVTYLGWAREPVAALVAQGADVTCVVPAAERDKPRADGFTGPVVTVHDHTRVDDVLAALAASGNTPEDYQTASSDDEFAIVPAAVMTQLGAGAGMSVPVALALRDKGVQNSLVRAAGIPTADSVRINDLAEVTTCGLGPPLVVKPPAGAGTQRTWLIPDVDAAERLAGSAPSTGPWLVERFVPGEELHVDGVVRAARVLLCSVSRYLHNVIEVRGGNLVGSATVDADTEGGLVADVTRLTADVLAAVGHTDGVFHLECFHGDGNLIFGECAGRIGGGMIAEAVRAKYGVDLYAEWAASVLGLPSPGADTPPTVAPDSLGWVNLSCPAGRIATLPDRSAIAGRPGVVDAQLWAAPGDVVGDPREGSHLLVAKAMVRAPREARARDHLMAVGRWFSSAVQVTRERTA